MSRLEERFWAKVDKRGPDECWEWRGAKDQHGYGKIRICGTTRRSTRVAWELKHGPIPSGLCVCHKCDNPSCVNVERCLFLGTQRTHPDRVPRGERHGSRTHPERVVRGENHSFARLTAADVAEIRRRKSEGSSQVDIARMFNVHKVTVFDIVHRKTWRHVP